MKRKILLIVVGIISGLMCVTNVRAATLTTNYTGVWAYHYQNGSLKNYGGLPFRYLDGVLGYCIEPNIPITVHTYNSYTDWSVTGYSDDVKRQMELIAYYGYEYPGHNTLEYYMATQELIWLFKDDYIIWKQNKSFSSATLNVDSEKEEIMRLVNAHNTMPSFVGSSYDSEFGTTISLADANNVLSNYDISTDLEYSVSGNVLTFKINKFGSSSINFTQKSLYTRTTTIFVAEKYRTQKIVIFGSPTMNSGSINVSANEVPVEFTKRDSETKEIIKNKSAKYKLITDETKEETIVNFDKTGQALVNVKQGSYTLEEVEAPYGYKLNKEKKKIVIDDNITLTDGKLKIDLYDEVTKGKIKIKKVNEEGEDLEGVTLGIYDSKYNLLETIVTTKEDNVSKLLPLGKYYVKELKALDGYILDNYYYEVDLTYKDQNVAVVTNDIKIVNEKIKCDIVYITSDKDGSPLKGVLINVFDKDGNKVYTGETDSDGKVTINNLPYGEYTIKQVKVPSGYILNEEEVKFYVNDSTCNSNINVTNEKTIMPVTSKQSSIYLLKFVILFGIGVYNFVKKDS